MFIAFLPPIMILLKHVDVSQYYLLICQYGSHPCGTFFSINVIKNNLLITIDSHQSIWTNGNIVHPDRGLPSREKVPEIIVGESIIVIFDCLYYFFFFLLRIDLLDERSVLWRIHFACFTIDRFHFQKLKKKVSHILLYF
jgi:hypothetical protein